MAPENDAKTTDTEDRSAPPAERVVTVARVRSKRSRSDGFEGIESLCKAVALAALLVVIGVGMFSRFYVARFTYLPTISAMEQGDIAEQLRAGHGFKTRIGRPLGLDKPAGKGLWEDVTYNPLYPIALAVFFKVRGAGDASVALFNGLVQFATGLLVYLIGVQLRGPRTGVFALLLYYCSIEAISTALDGTGLTLTAFLATLGLWLALRTRALLASGAPRGLLWSALCGAAFGLAYLSGGMTVLLIIPAALLVSVGQQRRWQAAGVVIAAFAVVLLPWVVRNLATTQTLSPRIVQYKLMMLTTTYPAGSVLQELPGRTPDPLTFAVTHPKEMAVKFVTGAAALYRQVPSFLNSYLFPFVLLFALVAGPGTPGRRLWGTVLAMVLLQAAVACLYDFDAESLRILMPAGICLGAAAIAGLAKAHLRRAGLQIAAAGLTIAVVVFPYAASLALGGENPQTQATTVRFLAPLKTFLSSDALVATDVPAALTWYTGVPSVMLPTKITGVNDLAARGADPDYIYLSARLLMGPPTDWNRRNITDEERRIIGTPLGLSDKNIPPVFERRAKRAPGVQIEKRTDQPAAK